MMQLAKIIGALALNTFREAIRNRVLHGIILVAFGLVIGSVLVGQLSLENDDRVVRDLGLAFTSLVTVMVAIFSGVSLLHLEIERKTIYTIVTKPVPRWAFILGKVAGLGLVLLAVEGLVAAVLVSIILIRGDDLTVIHFQAMIMIWFEGLVVAAITTLFSSFSTPFLSGLLTFGVFILGRLREALYIYTKAMEVAIIPDVVQAFGVIVPDLSLHRADLQIAYLVPLSWSYVTYTCLYSVLYSAIVVLLASAIFTRRDFV